MNESVVIGSLLAIVGLVLLLPAIVTYGLVLFWKRGRRGTDPTRAFPVVPHDRQSN